MIALACARPEFPHYAIAGIVLVVLVGLITVWAWWRL